MQVEIVQQGDKATLAIECTAAGKQALLTNSLSPRERQLLFLLDQDSGLSIQAVGNLLQKVNINDLAGKGWITYQLLSTTQLGQSTAVVNQHINVKFVNSVDKKPDGKAIKSFLSTYGALDDEAVPPPKATRTTTSVDKVPSLTPPAHPPAHSTSKVAAASMDMPTILDDEPLPEDLEAIMIAQTLLDDY